jgi:hypothetical protein
MHKYFFFNGTYQQARWKLAVFIVRSRCVLLMLVHYASVFDIAIFTVANQLGTDELLLFAKRLFSDITFRKA